MKACMFKPYIFCLTIFALLAGASLRAQKLLTIDEAIAEALKNNHDITLAKYDSTSAAIDDSFKGAAFYPRLNANTGIAYNNNDQIQKFNDGTKRERNGVKSNNFNAGIALNWTLFDGLRMFATRGKVEEFVKLGELNIKNQVVTTVAGVVTTYYNIVRQKQQLKAVEEQIDISQIRVNLTQQKLDIGVGAKPDVLQSKVDMNAQKARQLEQLSLIAQLKSALNRLMNVPPGNPFDVTDSIPINMSINVEDIKKDIENVNPSILIAKKNIDIANFALKEVKADRLPTISFNSNYNFSRLDNKEVVNPFTPLFSQNKGLNYGFTASIPILNNLNTKRLVKQAQLGVQTQELIYDNQKFLTYHSVNRAFRDYEQQKKALALEEENILLAKENLSIVLQTYRLNSATLVQLREAQISLSEAYDRLIAARYNTKVSEIELLSLKGELVK
ncbi:MAG: TolC family protein [Chitinophagaceae bacterium]